MNRLVLLIALLFIDYNIQSSIPQYISDGIEEPVIFYARENLNSDRKIARRGILVRRPKAKATVLICHGFMCDKYDASFLHLMFKDYNTMTFDFRAHGEEINDQQLCTLGRDESYDVLAASEFIKEHYALKDLPLAIYGFSMGAVATLIAGELNTNLCDLMILDCPFESSDKLIERGMQKLRFNVFGYELSLPCTSLLKNYAYNPYIQFLVKALFKVFAKMDSTQVNTLISPVYPEEAAKYITVPVFMIGCINDEKVPEEAVMSVYNGLQGYKRLWLTDGRRHFDTIFFKVHEYSYRVNRFIQRYLDGSLFKNPKTKIIRPLSKP